MTRVIIVAQGTTFGQVHSNAFLTEALREMGDIDVVEVQPTFTDLPRVLARQPLQDLSQAWAIRRALVSVMKNPTASTVVLLPTTTAALLLSSRTLRRCAVRFDALACENRRGLLSVPSRWLERWYMRRVEVLLPYSLLPLVGAARGHFMSQREVVPFPTPLSWPAAERRRRKRFQVVAYGASPWKKGLDLLLDGWAAADLPESARLKLVGVELDVVTAYLAKTGRTLPPKVEIVGYLPRAEFLALLDESAVYLASARYEDFGIAPLEAMARGALVVSGASGGPFEAGWILRAIRPESLAPLEDADALGAALASTLALGDSERSVLEEKFRAATAEYCESAVLHRLVNDVVPALRRLADRADEGS